jgi:guanylate kinase
MSTVVRGDLYIVSSPSGGGKTTLIRRLLERPPGEALHFSVSHTTRTMRQGEESGREYHFVSVTEFQRMVQRDEFLEHNEVHDNIYGTSRGEVLPRLAAGEDVILDIDVQGARDVRKAYPEAVTIFIVPASLTELERRLRGRGLDGEEPFETADQRRPEISKRRIFNMLSSSDLNQATLELESIVRARRLTPARQAARLRGFAPNFDRRLREMIQKMPEGVDSKFRLVLLIARRAEQLAAPGPSSATGRRSRRDGCAGSAEPHPVDYGPEGGVLEDAENRLWRRRVAEEETAASDRRALGGATSPLNRDTERRARLKPRVSDEPSHRPRRRRYRGLQAVSAPGTVKRGAKFRSP